MDVVGVSCVAAEDGLYHFHELINSINIERLVNQRDFSRIAAFP